MKAQNISITSLYALKAFCAFFVVALHSPSGSWSEYIKLISLIAVPTFFLITGYFLYTPDIQKLWNRTKSTLKKIAPMILILQLFYYCLSPIKAGERTIYEEFCKMIFFGHTTVGGHLWYLTTLFQGIIILFLTIKYTKWGGYLLIGLWFIRIAVLDYHDLIFGADSIVPSNSLAYLLPFAALPCLAMGYMVKKYEDKFLSYSHWGAIAATATVFFYLNEFVLSQISHTLSTILKPILFTTVIISVFIYALQHKTIRINNTIQYIGQHLSGNIYYFHGAVIFLLNTSYGYESFGSVYVFVSSVIVAYIIVALQKHLNINIFR